MSIASEITRLQGAKSDLKTSIEGKGVTVPSATKIDGYAALVDQIQTGGGGGHTGTVDTAGLQALGWDSDDIQWLQDHVWWDAEDDAEWAVTEANKAFGPNGATPLTWSNKGAQQFNQDIRYLPKIYFPANTTSLIGAFGNWPSLVAIPTHGWDMSTVTRFDQAFRNCANLRSLGDTSHLVTSAATNIGLIFGGCTNLESIDVSSWNTSNVTTFQQAFYYCTALTYLDLSPLSFAKATTISGLLQYCASLRSVKFPTTISAPVLTNVSNLALGCSCLEEFDINLNAPSLTTATTVIADSVRAQSIKIAISSQVLNNVTVLSNRTFSVKIIDLMGIDTTACAQSGIGTSSGASPFGASSGAATVKLGANFFKGTFTTLYASECFSWTRDSIYESLYTNQTTRDSNSNAVTVKLATQAYDRLSAQDISDIATKNITLTRG